MFVLSFLGLFLFAMPKETKAEEPQKYPYTAEICCDDGNCYYCICTQPGDEELWESIMCPDEQDPDLPIVG